MPTRQRRKQAETTEPHSKGVSLGRGHTKSQSSSVEIFVATLWGDPLAGIALALFANEMMVVRHGRAFLDLSRGDRE